MKYVLMSKKDSSSHTLAAANVLFLDDIEEEVTLARQERRASKV
jgi:hypothetical protein